MELLGFVATSFRESLSAIRQLGVLGFYAIRKHIDSVVVFE